MAPQHYCICPMFRHWRSTRLASVWSRVGQGESVGPSSQHREPVVPGCPGRSWAEQMALPEVRMETKLSFALAQYGCVPFPAPRARIWPSCFETENGRQISAHLHSAFCSWKHRGLHPLAQIPPPVSLRRLFPAAPVMLWSQGVGCAKPFLCHHPLPGFRKVHPGAPEEAEPGYERRPGPVELSKHWSVGGSPALQLWPLLRHREPSLPGGQELWQRGRPPSRVQRDALSHRQGSANCTRVTHGRFLAVAGAK